MSQAHTQRMRVVSITQTQTGNESEENYTASPDDDDPVLESKNTVR